MHRESREREKEKREQREIWAKVVFLCVSQVPPLSLWFEKLIPAHLLLLYIFAPL
jgi:hypothetical protein